MSLNISDKGAVRVVVVGGGFGGLRLVQKLARNNVEVVLIDRNNFHQFQPLLYQVATAELAPSDIAFPFRKLFHGKKNVHFRMAEVTAVDPVNKMVITSAGSLAYDHLVLSMGSSTNYFGMTDVAENSMPMKDLAEALNIRNTIFLNLEKAARTEDGSAKEALLNIVIVGGGATGVETAGAFAELKRHIEPKDYPDTLAKMNVWLIEGSDRLLGAMNRRTSDETLELMLSKSVHVILNDVVTGYSDGGVTLKSGRRIPTYNLIWTSGITVHPIKGMEECRRGRGGRIIVDDYFRVEGYEDIYIIGDAAIQSSETFTEGAPQQARYAMVQAEHLAENLARKFNGEELKPYREVAYPSMAVISRNNAFAEFKRVRISGFIGWILWVFIHLITILGIRNRFSVLWNWFWNYVTFDLPNRLIITPYIKPKGK